MGAEPGLARAEQEMPDSPDWQGKVRANSRLLHSPGYCRERVGPLVRAPVSNENLAPLADSAGSLEPDPEQA